MRFLACLAVFAVAPLATASTLTVGPSGSGAQFTEIQAAVDAAQDGDVILVQAGTYQKIVVDKAVRILGDGSSSVTISAPLATGVVLRDIGASEEVVLSGVRVFATIHPARLSMLVEDCLGTVVLDDVLVDGGGNHGLVGIEARDCALVLVLDSRILAAGVPVAGGNQALGAVRAIRSSLALSNCVVTGRSDANQLARASHGLEVRNNSRAFVWRSRIEGGDALDDLKPTLEGPGDGGAGVLVVSSHIEVFGGIGAALLGGDGASSSLMGEDYPGGAGLELRNNSSARVQQVVVIAGGVDGTGTVPAPATLVDATSRLQITPKHFPTQVSRAQQVEIDGSFDLTVEDDPGAVRRLSFALRTGPTTRSWRVDGYAVLAPATELLPPCGTLIRAPLFFQPREVLRDERAIGNPDLVTITG